MLTKRLLIYGSLVALSGFIWMVVSFQIDSSRNLGISLVSPHESRQPIPIGSDTSPFSKGIQTNYDRFPKPIVLASETVQLNVVDSLLSAWQQGNKEQMLAAENALIANLAHNDKAALEHVVAAINGAETAMKYRLTQALMQAGTEATIGALIDLAREYSSDSSFPALEALGSTQNALSPPISKFLAFQLQQAIEANEGSLALALGRSISAGGTAEDTVRLISMTDDPKLEEPMSTALMEAVGNIRSPKLIPQVEDYLTTDTELSTNAGIATGDALSHIYSTSSVDAFMRWAENVDFDKVGDQARYWFSNLAEDTRTRVELRSASHLHEFLDPRMNELIQQIAESQPR